MPARIRRLIPVVTIALGACGYFGGDDVPPTTDSTAAEAPAGAEGGPDSTAPSPPVVASDFGNGVPGPPSDLDSVADSSVDATDSVADASPAPDATAEAGQPSASQIPPTIESRLDEIARGQDEIRARLDSLAEAGIADEEPDSLSLPSGQEVLGNARESVRSFGVGVIWSIIVVVLFNLIIRTAVWVLDTLAEQNAARRLFYKRLVPVVRIILWLFATYLIVRVIFQVDYQGLLAAAAAIGVAVGLAAQDLLKNVFGGLILVFDQPFQVGDKVSVAGTYGEVVSIGLRSTRIVTPDDNRVSVPNSQMVDQQVSNANAGELNCQVVTDLFLPGWADEAAAKRIAFEAATSSKYVFLNKPIVVLVSDQFKETFLTRVRVKAYVLDPRLEFLLQSDITERARAGFREAGLLKPGHMRTHLVERSAIGIPPDSDPPESGDTPDAPDTPRRNGELAEQHAAPDASTPADHEVES